MLGKLIGLIAILAAGIVAAQEDMIAVQPTVEAMAVSEEQRPFVIIAERKVAIVGATVIDGSGAAPAPDRTILLEDGRISWVGEEAEAPVAGHRIINGRGKTVIPGIVGMHDHLHRPGTTYTGFTSTRLWLAGGVTAVQTSGAAEADREIALARAIKRNGKLGPEIFPSAPYVTGPGGNEPMATFASTEEARAFVREWSAKGTTWFKLYRHVQPPIAAAIIEEAHALGRKTTGHLCSLSYTAAARLGIDRLEHGLNAAADFVQDREEGVCLSNRAALDALDIEGEQVLHLIDTLVREKVVVTSTLPIIESGYPARFYADDRILDALSPEQRQRTENLRQASLEITPQERVRTERFGKVAAFEHLFVKRGGMLVAGPDPGRHVLPGFGNQRAAELLFEAGFTVPEIVRIMTWNGALVLGAGNRFGRIAPGFEADLVLLDGELSTDIHAINRPVTTFSNGLGFDPEALRRAVKGQVGIR